jgi:hypothetical protein
MTDKMEAVYLKAGAFFKISVIKILMLLEKTAVCSPLLTVNRLYEKQVENNLVVIYHIKRKVYCEAGNI